MYANDYDDFFPHQSWIGNPFTTDEYHIMFQPYVKNWGIMYDPFRKYDCNQYGNQWKTGEKARCMGYGVNLGINGLINGNESGLFEGVVRVPGSNPSVDLLRGRATTFFPEPANMVLFQTTMDEPMYTTDFTWQQFDDGSGVRNRNAKPRNDGRWVRVFVDGHVHNVMVGRYRTSSYPHLIMPKNLKDVEAHCWSLDAKGGSNRTCGQWIDYFMTNRVAW